MFSFFACGQIFAIKCLSSILPPLYNTRFQLILFSKSFSAPDVLLFLISKGIILLTVFFKIRCLRLGWNAFTRIITELAALCIYRLDTTFYAQDIFFIQLCAVTAIAAGFFDFLSEKHGSIPRFYIFSLDYTLIYSENLLFFSKLL